VLGSRGHRFEWWFVPGSACRPESRTSAIRTTWISQIYTLDDFVGDSDAWCGLIHTPAYVQDKKGERIIG
jgi:hypothetical protein